MAEKIINTKIALRWLDYATWSAEAFQTEKPLKGEVWFCEVPTGNANATTAPTMLFKVGDGVNNFGTLKWASALAADVYEWAKVAGGNVFTKEGAGNVISGIVYDETLNGGKGGFKYTTASVATAEGLEALQKEVYGENGSADDSRIDKLEKDIADNRDAWLKDDNDNTTYQFSIPTSGDDKGKLLIEKKEIGETAWTRVDAYDVTTPDELAAALANYYTKEEIDGVVEEINGKIDGIDTGVHAVALAGGTDNGTLKLTVDGKDVDNIAVTGLQDAAYATIASLNATAKGYADAVEAKLPTSADYGVLEVKGDETSGVVVDNTDAQRPIVKIAANTYDAYGAAAQALADAKEYADKKPHENTAHSHSVGDGLKKTGNGGIDGDVKYELNVAMKLEDGDIIIYDKDNNNEVARLDAAELLEDSYLNDVEIVGNELQFTWKMDDGSTKTDSVDLTHLVDVYSGEENDYIKVTVDNYKIAAELLKVDTDIIEDEAITYEKIDAELQEGIDHAFNLAYSIPVDTDPSVNGPFLRFGVGYATSYGKIYLYDENKEENRLITKEELDGSIDGLGALAGKDTVGTSDIDNGAITYDKLDEELQGATNTAEALGAFISIETDPSTIDGEYMAFYDGHAYIGTGREEDDIVATLGDVKAVEAKIPTELGVMSIAKGDDTITVGGTAQNPTIAVTAGAIGATQLSEDINTAIGHGTEAYGWGNHADAGYIRKDGAAQVSGLTVQGRYTDVVIYPDYPFMGSYDATSTIELRNGKYPNEIYRTVLQVDPEVTENVYAVLPTKSGVLALTSDVTEALNQAKAEVATLAGEGNTTTVKAVADRVKDLEDANHISNVEADTGLKVIAGTNGANNKVAIDDSVVFILDCNW